MIVSQFAHPPVIDRKNIYLRIKNDPRKKTVEIEKCYFCCPSVHYVKRHFGNSKSKKSLLAHFLSRSDNFSSG